MSDYEKIGNAIHVLVFHPEEYSKTVSLTEEQHHHVREAAKKLEEGFETFLRCTVIPESHKAGQSNFDLQDFINDRLPLWITSK